MNRLPFADIVGLIGLFGFGLWVNFSQVLHTLKVKSVEGLAPQTYMLLFIYVCCLFYCAIGTSIVFILSNIWAICISGTMLILINKYGKKEK